MRKDTKNFKISAEYDFNTAKSMFTSRKYIYVVFMCHIAIEKALKAIVAENLQASPPKTHNLIYLLKLAETNLPESLFEFVTKISNAGIVTRYPSDFQKLLKIYPSQIVKQYLVNTREVLRCLKKDRRLKE